MRRIQTVPNRPLVMAKERMDFAFEHAPAGAPRRFVVAEFTPLFGDHDADRTKLQFDIHLALLDDTGAEIARARASGLTCFNDPSDQVGTPASYAFEADIADKLLLLLNDVPAWAERTQGIATLHQRLAIGGEVPAPVLPPVPPPPIVQGVSVKARPYDFGMVDEGGGKLTLAPEFRPPLPAPEGVDA